MKKFVCPALILIFSLFAAGFVSSLEFAVKIIPEVIVPLSESSANEFDLGGGVDIAADAILFGGFAPYVESGYHVIPLNGTGTALSLYNGGAGLSFSVFPIPRLKLRTGASAGLFRASRGEESRTELYWKGRLEAGYRFTPSMALLAGVGYSYYANSTMSADPLYRGLSAGLILDFGLGSTAGRASGLRVEAIQSESVFPIRYYAYDKDSFGSIRITNRESAEIRDVEVSFSMLGENATKVECGNYRSIPRGGTVEAPLMAVLGDRCLEFTEGTKVEGVVTVSYRILDDRTVRTFPASVSFLHRNAANWVDARVAAAFVSPNDVAVLDLTKYAAGLVRERIRPDIDSALQYGIGVFETLRLTGVAWSPDPSAPYAECRIDPERIDYIQYPFQTFAYRGGDSDDIAILLAASMESVGLSSALIPLEDGVLVAFALAAPEDAARKAFSDTLLFAWRDGKAWIPLDPKLIREGFLSAWKRGAEAWNAAVASGQDKVFYPLKDAWTAFPPVGVSDADTTIPKPKENLVAAAFENALGTFVELEVGPRAMRMLTEMGEDGGTGRQLNSLGILYARYGLLNDARREFEKAVSKGSTSAIINLANIVFLLKDYEAAAAAYERALSVDPTNKAALLGLARSKYELDAYADADDLFSRVERIDSVFASRYAYLSANVAANSSRASAAGGDGALPWILDY